MSRTPDGKFEILFYQQDDDSYFYSNTSYDWRVVSVETGDELAAFSGGDDQDANGSRKSGTQSVAFTPEGDAAIAEDADGTKERVELPASMRVVDEGRSVEITWRDGKVERRERAPVFKFSKYGEVFARPLVDPPADERDPTKKKR